MRRITLVVGCALVLGLAAPVGALDSLGDGTVVVVFTASDVLADVASEGEQPWESFEEFMLGGSVYAAPDGEVAAAADDVYVLVNAWTPPYEYTGLVHYDGTGFVHLVQTGEPWSGGLTKKMLLRSVTVPPPDIAAGPLAAGHPVLLVYRGLLGGSADAFAADLVLVDPTDPPALTVDEDGEPLGYVPLYTFTGTQNANGDWSILDETAVAIAGDGTIYVGPWRDGSITKLSYVNGIYAESVLSTSFAAGGGLTIDGAGYLYTWEQGMAWRPADPDGGEYREIFRIDPATGAATSYAGVARDAGAYGWTWTDDGRFWIGLSEQSGKGRKAVTLRYVAEVVAGSTTKKDGAVSDSAYVPKSLAPGVNGALYVLEQVKYLTSPGSGDEDALYVLTPGSGSSDGGGKPPKKK